MTDPIPFHTFIWKVASRCNLNCSYCFVYNLRDTRWQDQPAFMSQAVALKTAQRIREHCEAHQKEKASIVFHGGEPLLGGAKHLAAMLSAIESVFKDSGISLTLGMQSNGLLFDAEIGDLLLNRRMSIGISLDGPPEINDLHRVDHEGRPTSHKLESKLALLTSDQYRDVFSGFLCVVNPQADPVAVTKYLLSYQPRGIDFLLPLNNYDCRPVGKESDLAATPYADWLIAAFDYWFSRGVETKIRIFNSLINMLFEVPSEVESLGLHPVDLIVIESNGELEAVDSLKSTFDGATKLGYSVFENAFDEALKHDLVVSRHVGAASLCLECRSCPLLSTCGGGYLPHRYSSSNGFDNPSVYCADLQKLIKHVHTTVSSALNRELLESRQ